MYQAQFHTPNKLNHSFQPYTSIYRSPIQHSPASLNPMYASERRIRPNSFSGNIPSSFKTPFSSDIGSPLKVPFPTDVRSTFRTPFSCNRRLDYSDFTSMSTPPFCNFVTEKECSTKITPLDINLPEGHPDKCIRPGCHNKRFVEPDGSIMYYCGKQCEKAVILNNHAS